jgi:hypothetical protein
MDRIPPRSTTSLAGGFPIALGLVIGGALGVTQGHAWRWLLIGTAIGTAVALAIWLIDRRR